MNNFKDTYKGKDKKGLSTRYEPCNTEDCEKVRYEVVSTIYSYCKECIVKRHLDRDRTKEGLLSKIYRMQKTSSKRRGHDKPNYSKENFIKFASSLSRFHELHKVWIESGYKTELIPSFDRVDSNKPYTLDNLQVITWEQNCAKGRDEHAREVTVFDLDGNVIEVFRSKIETVKKYGRGSHHVLYHKNKTNIFKNKRFIFSDEL